MSAARSTSAPGATERVRDLADVPSFPAVYAAALDPRSARRGARRGPTLPSIAYRVRDVRVDAARARDFDHLMGGPATDLVHPGVLHVLAFPVSLALMARRDFPFALLGLVHLRNQVLQHRPVRVGELVDVECRVRDLRPHRKGRTFEAVSTILGQDGAILATDVSTYLATGDESEAAADGDSPQTERRPRQRTAFEAPRPTGRWRLGADTGRRYAAVAGDVNPIHLSGPSAKLFGFPRAIAHGMYTASRAFTEARVDLSRPLRWDVTFDAPVTLPGTVLVAYDDSSAGTVRCTGWRAGSGDKGPRRCFEVEVTTLG
ncbi:acyl dehydratase [Brachybacterium sp. P6-10-X1]|uniref:MaoC/PaaZ C-terminal domain-containing protein n=1 Tax=Brachybacterium sp. P6-10-X1 TaxID=1903186 RepID=UPI0009718109|nr:MaoC/PaaZ C-terminal domain-containing protein [Brachybacterium sp. P6-10-X1]APX32707.1 acyl dehydratase [Brachybacterium sp. P6-10-X1]